MARKTIWKKITEKYNELNERMARGFGSRYYNYYLRQRKKREEAKKKITPPPTSPPSTAKTTEWTTQTKVGVLIALVVVGVFFGYLFLSYAERHQRIEAINTVRSYEILDGLTVDDLVQDEVVDSWLMGSPKRAVWDAERETGSRYIVTLQFKMELPEEDIYFHGARWRVNVKTNEIEPLDDGARAYMGL